jgi:hypothetical protein
VTGKRKRIRENGHREGGEEEKKAKERGCLARQKKEREREREREK